VKRRKKNDTNEKKEQKASDSLNRIAKKWPETLWLFSASGTLCVMRKGENGEQVETVGGGIDQDYVLSTIDIMNDGGDW